MTQTFRTRVENICILILFCLSLGMFALSFLHRLPAEAALLISTEMDWMVQRASAVVLLTASKTEARSPDHHPDAAFS